MLMQQWKIPAIGGITLLVVIGLIVWGLQSSGSNADDAPVVYYYGAECPHCQEVAKFLEENNIAEKVEFTKKEVWHNPANNREMTRRAKECGIDAKELGVPFLWNEGACLSGQDQVIEFFRQKADISLDNVEVSDQEVGDEEKNNIGE